MEEVAMDTQRLASIAGSSWKITSVSLGMNDAALGSVITITGKNLDTMPARLMVGPYVAQISIINVTTAVATIPSVSNVTAQTSCRTMSDSDILALLESVSAAEKDRIFAGVVLSRTATDFDLYRTLCQTVGPTWLPNMFSMGGSVVAAPNMTGLNYTLYNLETAVEMEFVEAGSSHNVLIKIPDHGPVYAGDKISPIVRAGPGVTVSDVKRILTNSIQRRSGDTEVNMFSTTIFVDPTKRISVETWLEVEIPEYQQIWRFRQQTPVRIPAIDFTAQRKQGYVVTFTLRLVNGSTLHNPTMSMIAPATIVPVVFGSASSNCNISSANTKSVSCAGVMIHRVSNVSELQFFTGQLVVPPYFSGDVNISITASATNADPISKIVTLSALAYTSEHINITKAPYEPGEVATNKPHIAINKLTVSSIFAAQPDGGLHFVIITLICYFVLLGARTVYYVWRRRTRPEIGFDRSEVTWTQFLLPMHVWVGMVWPWHYRCANIHITLGCATLMGLYAVISSFFAWSDSSASLATDVAMMILVGAFAAFTQIAVRPILNTMFFMYVIFDPTEVESDVAANKSVDDNAKYIEDVEMLAPGHFQDGEFLREELPECGTFTQLTVDQALEGITKTTPHLRGSIGGLNAALDAVDASIPLQEDVIILEESDDGNSADSSRRNSAPTNEDTNMDAIKLSLVSPGSKHQSIDPDIKRFSLSDNSNEGAARGRSNTLVRLRSELHGAEIFTEEDQARAATTTSELTKEAEEEEEDEESSIVIVHRQVLNFPWYGYAICAVYIFFTAMITYLNTSGWSKSTLNSFWYTMICAAVADFLVAEPVFVGLVVLYRYVTGDNGISREMFPYEGEEQFRDEE